MVPRRSSRISVGRGTTTEASKDSNQATDKAPTSAPRWFSTTPSTEARANPTSKASGGPSKKPSAVTASEETTPTSKASGVPTSVARKSPKTPTTAVTSSPKTTPSSPKTTPSSVKTTPSSAKTTPSSANTTTFLRRSPRFNKGSDAARWRQYMHDVEDDFVERNYSAKDTDRELNSGKGSEVSEGKHVHSDGDSEYEPSGSLHADSPVEDEDFTSLPRYPEFREERDLINDADFKFEVGMQFESPDEFRKAIRHHAIVRGFDLQWKKNEGPRISVKCRAESCPFSLYCSWNSDRTIFAVKSFNSKHSFSRPVNNHQLTKKWIAKKYLEHYRSDPNLKWQLLKDMVQRDVGLSIGQHTCYRVRKIALEQLHDRNNEQYGRLWDYAHVLLKNNPGSYVKVKTTPIPNDTKCVMFEAIFVSFGAMIKGMLNGCRPVIGMDGCHLKSTNGGILLSAVSRDPNNQMYLVAYAVVEVENRNTWSWFITTLLEALGVENVQGWTFICDRQKGLVESLKQLVPRADVRFCCRHLYANFKEKFKGLVVKRLLWKAAAAYTVQEHVEAMNQIRDINMEAYKYLDGIERQLWARSYFSQTSKCDLLVNNICESFNKFILEARDKPILTMLELMRRQLMRRFEKKRQCSEKVVKYGGKIMMKLNEMEKASRQCTPYQSGPDLFEVVEKDRQVVINLRNNNCSCNQWQLSGIPCRHAISCIQYLRNNPEDYVHDFYSKEKYMAAYRDLIYPIPDKSTWEKQNMLKIKAPKHKKQPGRPKKIRQKAADEVQVQGKQKLPRTGKLKSCSKCKKLGHNARSCRSDVVTPSNAPTGKKRGRPRQFPLEEGQCSTGTKRGRKRAPTAAEGGGCSQQGSSVTQMGV